MKPLRTGILGCGGFARRHAQILSTLDEVELTAFCDRHPERAGSYSAEFTAGQAPVYTNHEKFIAEAGSTCSSSACRLMDIRTKWNAPQPAVSTC
jgi:predicted dehydrogenase